MVDKKLYQQVKEEMKKHRNKKHWSKKDLYNILEAKKSGDWSKVHKSKLYNEYGPEYCSLLEVLCQLGY